MAGGFVHNGLESQRYSGLACKENVGSTLSISRRLLPLVVLPGLIFVWTTYKRVGLGTPRFDYLRLALIPLPHYFLARLPTSLMPLSSRIRGGK